VAPAGGHDAPGYNRDRFRPITLRSDRQEKARQRAERRQQGAGLRTPARNGAPAMHVNDLLKLAVESGASDLHLKVGGYPSMRMRGSLQPLSRERRLEPADMSAIAEAVIPPALRERFKDDHEIDLAYSVPGLGRFRCNAFQQRGTIGMVFRVIPMRIGTIAELALPRVLGQIAAEERGLVLVTGTTGSGKSTTLAAIIDEINTNRTSHVITIEDPIEYLHRDNRSIINQREIGVDTKSFAYALRSALRQDPDVILVGEMRDYETVETALLAAETGHLVFSTLHTVDATETINRIITVFPPHQQKQVRMQLASVLRAVVSQRLIPRADGQGRAPAVEVLINTPFIKDCIVDKEKTHLIRNAIAQGTSQYGMQTFDQSIFYLYERELISYEEALRWASNVDEFMLRVQGISTTSDQAREEMANVLNGAGPEITRFGNN
jgi:twitching motility protein PilT